MARKRISKSNNALAEFTPYEIALFAKFIGWTVEKSEEMLSQYGRGYVYHRSGIVLPDCERTRLNIGCRLGNCMVVPVTGSMYTYTHGKAKDLVGGREKRKLRKEVFEEKYSMACNKLDYRAEKELERLFEDGMTKPSPKRQGKADSLGDIGKYKTVSAAKMPVCESAIVKGGSKFWANYNKVIY